MLAGEQSDTFAFFAIRADDTNTWMRVTSHTPHTHRLPSLSTHQDSVGGLTCVQSGAAGFTTTYAVRFNPAGTKCYISQLLNVQVCDVLSNGDLTACTVADATAAVRGVYINAAGTVAYLVSSGNLRRCPIKPDGTFDTCVSGSITSGLPGDILVAGE